MDIIINSINKTAKETYDGEEITAENYSDQWVPHWFKTAENIYNDFVVEGLETSAKFTSEWIQANEKHLSKKGKLL